jgi:hypothetical protein
LRRDGALMVAENETVVESAETAAAAAPAGDGQAAVGTKLEFQVSLVGRGSACLYSRSLYSVDG